MAADAVPARLAVRTPLITRRAATLHQPPWRVDLTGQAGTCHTSCASITCATTLEARCLRGHRGGRRVCGRLPSRRNGLLGHLTSALRWRTTCERVPRRRSQTALARQVDVLRELDRLRVEIEALRASRKRLVVAADADRRSIERDLHDGVHQLFVALAVNLQLLRQSVASDPEAAGRLVEEMVRDVQRGLDETVLLAQRIYPPMLEAGGLAALLRSAAVDAGVPASVEVAAGPALPAGSRHDRLPVLAGHAGAREPRDTGDDQCPRGRGRSRLRGHRACSWLGC